MASTWCAQHERKEGTVSRRKSTAEANNVLPSNLSWRRSIDVTEGAMVGLLPAEGSLVDVASILAEFRADGGKRLRRIPVEVRETTVRGAIGFYKAGYDKQGRPLPKE